MEPEFLTTEQAARRLSRRGLPTTPRYLEELRRRPAGDGLPFSRDDHGVSYAAADLDALVRRLLRIPDKLDLDSLPMGPVPGGWGLIEPERASWIIRHRLRVPCSPATLRRRRAANLGPPWTLWAGRVWYERHSVTRFCDAADGFDPLWGESPWDVEYAGLAAA